MTRFWITLEEGVTLVLAAHATMHGGEIFVPKIPSMSIVDLSRVVAGDCDVDFIGVRRGEKTHEVLVSEEEARYTLELDDMFVVLPLDAEKAGVRWPRARVLSDGFRYSSDENPEQLSAEALMKLLGPLT
jgi:UDP-N-acetylglucosamine 4,6-dehydratase